MARRKNRTGNKIRDFAKQRVQKVTPGTPPGAFVISDTAERPVIDVIQFNADELNHWENCGLDSLPKRKTGTVTWMNIVGLGDKDVVLRIADQYGLHDLAVEDVVNTHQRPKFEEYEDHFYTVLRLPSHVELLDREQISIFVGKDFVLTWQEHSGDCFRPIRDRLKSKKRMIRSLGSDFLAYALIDTIVDSYFPVLEHYTAELDRIEDELADELKGDAAKRDPIIELYGLRTEIRMLRRDAWAHRELVRTLIADESNIISDETRLHLRDVLDHTHHLVELAEACRDSCNDLHDLCFTFMSVRMNEIMKVLTIIATIFMPLGFITGLYGMNFDTSVSSWNMPETRWYFGYPFAIALMLAISAAMLLFFRRRGWLRTR